MARAASGSRPDADMLAEVPPTSAPEPDPTPHRRFLWGLCYRMTGSAADAEDLVQETLLRALERPPPDTKRPLRPWLTRVAMNLARDHLRRRKKRAYPGVWLPEPVATAEEGASMDTYLGLSESPETRFGAMESASYAFLVALEILTPSQRAVLILRDVLDCSVLETAEALEMSEANVKTTLHRARKALEARRGETTRPGPDAGAIEQAFVKLMSCFATGSVADARALLSQDVQALSDGGGETFAAQRPVLGREKVAKMYAKLASRSSDQLQATLRDVNGKPALVGRDPGAKSPNAKGFVMCIELDEEGLVKRIHSVLAPKKLRRIFADIAAST